MSVTDAIMHEVLLTSSAGRELLIVLSQKWCEGSGSISIRPGIERHTPLAPEPCTLQIT